MMLINGTQSDSVPANDRGLQFGDGCFTTALISHGQVLRLGDHLQRLREACERLAIPCTDWQQMAQEMSVLARDKKRAVLKVVISRGSGGRGYSAAGCQQPRRIISVTDYPLHYDDWRINGITLATSPLRLGLNPALAGIKHLNRLEQVMIRQFIDRAGVDEALVLDYQGRIVECCTANIFWRCGEELFTPRVDAAGVDGTMRRYLIRILAEQGYACQTVAEDTSILQAADEIFICNSLMPVVPVIRIDDRTYHAGALTRRLSDICNTPG
ncbi:MULTISPECIES: aminodeoxychorismate lyase [unclassified Tatumella]|uniref:aminodeoxychorismate lyase n=1 Tax=unclassified Tatumella TaxID=2649542 RepID=UPI001BAF5CBC|nr:MULTISPECIES: aminodeoxychorismate lyase [unclassified Tatumella]MBS0877647.1 aminodeoxychorismate lyase [Tatumella sp. JGM82]MBS0891352.1 aminodeoxychorismate lyase [Tatumella sp. JGM94]MBS0902179.1 aminodeoxychorismate lyase [Tatumella sp. JGM100]